MSKIAPTYLIFNSSAALLSGGAAVFLVLEKRLEGVPHANAGIIILRVAAALFTRDLTVHAPSVVDLPVGSQTVVGTSALEIHRVAMHGCTVGSVRCDRLIAVELIEHPTLGPTLK